MLDGSTVFARTRALRGVRIGSVVAVALAAAFIAWLFIRHRTKNEPPAKIAEGTAVPRVVSTARLRAIAATTAYPLYWAARRSGLRYELTETGSRTYIRYLPANVAPGDPRPRFLTIGTYADRNAFAQTRRAGKRPAAVTLPLGGGRVPLHSPKRSTSLHFAYPGPGVQGPGDDPSARSALP